MNTTDKELLELAAKAADIGRYVGMCGDYEPPEDWSPLEDDGDALRLAVMLSISIDPRKDAVCTITPSGKAFIETGIGSALDSSTRLAIVKAAAEIGRMKDKE